MRERVNAVSRDFYIGAGVLITLMIAVAVLSGCQPKGIDANSAKIVTGARAAVGTSLIGANGKTAEDNRKIGSTVARLCRTGTWTPTECAKHEREGAL